MHNIDPEYSEDDTWELPPLEKIKIRKKTPDRFREKPHKDKRFKKDRKDSYDD